MAIYLDNGGGAGVSTYLKLDGSNANTNIDIGTYDFTTTGDISATNFIGALTGNADTATA